jgi:hypothetical protein
MKAPTNLRMALSHDRNVVSRTRPADVGNGLPRRGALAGRKTMRRSHNSHPTQTDAALMACHQISELLEVGRFVRANPSQAHEANGIDRKQSERAPSNADSPLPSGRGVGRTATM